MKQELTKENKNENIMVKHSGFAVSKKREEKKLRACERQLPFLVNRAANLGTCRGLLSSLREAGIS